MTHSDLVKLGAKWLRRKCAIVITELVTQGETPDVIGWHGTHSVLIECKTSRADFLADLGKPFRRHNCQGIGMARYYLTPSSVIRVEDLPFMWGLLEVTDHGIQVTRKSEYFEEVNSRQEIGILLSALRRVAHGVDHAVSIKCYTIQSKNTATISLDETIEQTTELFKSTTLPQQRNEIQENTNQQGYPIVAAVHGPAVTDAGLEPN